MAGILVGATFLHGLALAGGARKTATLDCGRNAVMTGVFGRTGMLIDQIGIVCRRGNSNGSLGSEFTRGPVGSPGGSPTGRKRCRSGEVVTRALVALNFGPTQFVAACKKWSSSSRRAEGSETRIISIGGVPLPGFPDWAECSGNQVGKGIRVEYSSTVEKIGFRCRQWNR